MICNNCGNQLETFNKFCPKCGASVQPPSPPPMGSGPAYSPPQMPMTGPPVGQPARKSSCGKIILILAIILILIGAAIAAAVYFGYRFVEKTLKESEAYTVAVNALKAEPLVKERLGDITETGFPLGAFTTNADGSGDAAFTMSVKGTKGSGQYQVELRRRNSVWSIQNGFVRLPNGEMIPVASKSSDEDADNVNSDTDTDFPVMDSSTTVNDGVLNDKAISLPEPSYPPIARNANASGMVVVRVLVDEDGDVESARAVSGHPLLQASAVAAARQAKFPPRRRAGKRVKVLGVLQYTFTSQ